MRTLLNPVTTIRDALTSAGCLSSRAIRSSTGTVSLADLLTGSNLDCHPAELAGRSILLVTRDQLAAALALAAVDGIAERVILCPPDTAPEHVPALIRNGRVDAILSDYELPDVRGASGIARVGCGSEIVRRENVAVERRLTEWVLLSSGTTGAPKMIVHSLASLTAPIGTVAMQCGTSVWGTFYDIRRYGGLQIFLRAVVAGGSVLLSGVSESIGAYLTRLGEYGATHVSGTPSHWRHALMSPPARRIRPSYVRLSGEAVDQGILNTLRSAYPEAAIAHAFASTEGGVAFEVNDGLAGFPMSTLDNHADVEMKICNDSLRIRSSRTASRYLDETHGMLRDAEGFVDTGDIVELRGGRYYFLGRRNGVINVGGLKVYPEEVEAVINRHPAVLMSVVRPHRNPVTGSLVSADILLQERSQPEHQTAAIKVEILEICRQNLARHKVPVLIHYVHSVELAAAGKLLRHYA